MNDSIKRPHTYSAILAEDRINKMTKAQRMFFMTQTSLSFDSQIPLRLSEYGEIGNLVKGYFTAHLDRLFDVLNQQPKAIFGWSPPCALC